MTADAVLLIAFGGPTAPDEIRPFLANVTRGRPIPPERLEVVAHHYELIGGRSPLNELTLRQARALEAELQRRGEALPVFVGMRNWHPFLHETLADMHGAGVRRCIGLILSPQQNEAGWERYKVDVAEARQRLGERAPDVVFAQPWSDHPLFLDAVADNVAAALAQLPAEARATAGLIFTAHSIPTASAAKSPYVEQLSAAAAGIARRLGHSEWELAYQSRSGNPRDPWLEPDIGEVLRARAVSGARAVVVAPIGFVCDHVEVLYDLDIEAKAIADECGLEMVRAGAVNDHPLFIRMLADLVARTMEAS